MGTAERQFISIKMAHGENMPWARVTHVRLLNQKADTPKAQSTLDYIRGFANESGIAALVDIESNFPGRQLLQKGRQGAMRFDLRHFSNERSAGSNPQDKGLIELGYLSEGDNAPFVEDSEFMENAIAVALNQILYGPPGTGKTYATINAALDILDPEFAQANRTDRAALKRRYDELAEQGLIRFVTFHQSFAYEDFVEGLRANTDDDGQLRYEVADGIFKTVCEAASARVTQKAPVTIDLNGRRIWKMSIGNSHKDDDYLFEEAVDNDYVLLGWGGGIDFAGCKNRGDIAERFQKANKQFSDDDYPVAAVDTFLLKIQKGDIIVVTDGNLKFRAIAEVTGYYRLLTESERGKDYVQSRPVRWLRIYSPSLSYEQLMKKRFMQKTLYELNPYAIDMAKLGALLSDSATTTPAASGTFVAGETFGSDYRVTHASNEVLELRKPNGKQLAFPMSLIRGLADYVQQGKLTIADIREKQVFTKVPESLLEPYIVNGYNNILPPLVERLSGEAGSTTPQRTATPINARVLIIDEINRGNISRIFGELITLIEPSKRIGAPEALEATLPYSKERFGVPANVYLIGTMNTADRSLAGLDIALRRRFTFREMLPRPDLLDGVMVGVVNIGAILRVMNQRIEVLLDRDHCLGHAYFMPLKDDPSLTTLAAIFRNQIIPLLQEYFFEDWQRIQWVLNDHQKTTDADCFLIQPPLNHQQLFGEGVNPSGQGTRWNINDSAFDRIDAYRGILSAQA